MLRTLVVYVTMDWQREHSKCRACGTKYANSPAFWVFVSYIQHWHTSAYEFSTNCA